MDRVRLKSAPADGTASERLAGPGPLVACAFAWLAVMGGFHFLDRHLGLMGRDMLLAAAWAVPAFGWGAWRLWRGADGPGRLAHWMSIAAGLLAVPLMAVYVLPRWLPLMLLLVVAARAPAMLRRRDLYLALAGIVAAALMTAVHWRAEWTVWFHLGPAAACVALALAWDAAADARLSAWIKASLALGFLALSLAAGLVLHLLLPLPNGQGFGFLPPGTPTPGVVQRAGPGSGGGDETAPAPGQDGGGAGGGSLAGRLQGAIGELRGALRDPGLPAWQRWGMDGLLAGLETLAGSGPGGEATPGLLQLLSGGTGEGPDRQQVEALADALASGLRDLLLALLLAALAWWLWRRRWQLGAEACAAAAGLLVRAAPAAALWLCARGAWCLARSAGAPAARAPALRELVEAAPALPPGARLALRQALALYGGWRHGGLPARPADAREGSLRLHAAAELLRQARRRG